MYMKQYSLFEIFNLDGTYKDDVWKEIVDFHKKKEDNEYDFNRENSEVCTNYADNV